MNFIIKMFVKVIVFISIPCLLLVVVFPFEPDGYMASMPDKIKRVGSVASPKIVVVGDSNVAFGIDSAMIESYFDMPVVNFGLHGGLGQAFHTELLRGNIGRGDIIIIAPAHYNDPSTLVQDPVLAWLVVENDLSIWGRISDDDKKEMIQYLFSYCKKGVRGKVNSLLSTMILGNKNANGTSYSKGAFNEYGDNDFAGDETEIILEEVLQEENFSSGILSDTMQDYWNEYNDYVKSKGATLVISVPPILDARLQSSGQLESLQSSLENGLQFPVISKLSSYVYPIEYFYNTNLHLNRRGKTIRTNQLIQDLDAWMSESEKQL